MVVCQVPLIYRQTTIIKNSHACNLWVNDTGILYNRWFSSTPVLIENRGCWPSIWLTLLTTVSVEKPWRVNLYIPQYGMRWMPVTPPVQPALSRTHTHAREHHHEKQNSSDSDQQPGINICTERPACRYGFYHHSLRDDRRIDLPTNSARSLARPIKLGRSSRWFKSETEEWISSRIIVSRGGY